MKSIFVTTPDNIKVEYRLAGAGSRVGAAVIDTAIQSTAFFIIILIAVWFAFDLTMDIFDQTAEWFTNIAAVLLLMYFVIFFGYFLLFEIITKGQTPGKKIFGLRTIRANGQPITFIQSIIRNVVRVTIDNMGLGVIMMLFTKNHTRLGDMLASTIVISENPSKYKTESLLWRPEMASYDDRARATINNDYPITYEEYEIIKDYFARKGAFLENGRYAEVRVREYFAQKFGIDMTAVDRAFLEMLMDGHRGY